MNGNRLASLFAALSVSIVASGAFAFPGALPRGDVNQDGVYDLGDVLVLSRHLRGDVALDDKGLFAADVAPLDGSGSSQPDGEVNAADLLVLLRIVGGDLAPEAPTLTLNDATSGDGIADTLSGTTSANQDIHLFVGDGAGAVVHLETVTADGMGDFSFSDMPLVFEGENQFFAVAENAAGFPSASSPTALASWTSTAPCSPSGSPSGPLTITGAVPVIWTARCSEYSIPVGGLVVDSGSTLVLGPGVTLTFPEHQRLRVLGEIRVFGAAGSKVLFRSDNPEKLWEGMVVLPPFAGSASAFISYARFEGAGRSSSSFTAAIFVSTQGGSASLALRNSEIIAPLRETNGITARGNVSVTIDRTYVQGVNDPSPAASGITLVDVSQAAEIQHTEITAFAECVNILRGALPHGIRYTKITDCNIGIHTRVNPTEIFPENEISLNDTGIRVQPTGLATPRIHDSSIFGNGANVEATGAWLAGKRRVIDASRNYWGLEDGFAIADTIVDAADALLDPPGQIQNTVDVNGNVNAAGVDRVLVDFTPFRKGNANGQLEYQYVSGHMSNDFGPEAPALGLRQAVGPMLLWPGEEAAIPAGTTVETFVSSLVGAPRVDVLISGNLNVGGTPASPVEFVAPGAPLTEGVWWGLRFDGANASGQLDHVTVLNAFEAIYAGNGADLGVDSAHLQYFSKAGVVLDEMADTTEILNSTIDGLTPEPNIYGIHIQGEGSPTLQGNLITNLIVGLHVTDASSPVINGRNTITDNVWGIWIQGPGRDSSDLNPRPVIHDNNLFGNDVPFVVPPPKWPGDDPEGSEAWLAYLAGPGPHCQNTPANVCLSHLALSDPVTVDATGNWWGTTSLTDIMASIVADPESVFPLDISDFYEAQVTPGGPPGSPVPGSSPAFSSLATNVRVNTRRFRPDNEESLVVTFDTPLAGTATLKVYDEDELAQLPPPNPLPPPRRTITQSVSAGSDQSIEWDGRDGSGKLVEDEAYAYVLEVTAGGFTDVYDPPLDPNRFGAGEFPPLPDPTNSREVLETSYNTFTNDYWVYRYHLEPHPLWYGSTTGLGDFACRVTLEITESGSTEPFSPFEHSGVPLLSDEYRYFIFDGRRQDGSILDQIAQFYFPRPSAMKSNFVLVEGTVPEVRGPEPSPPPSEFGFVPKVAVKANPYLVRHAYDQITTLAYEIDVDADVTVSVIDPNGAVVATPVVDQLQSGTNGGSPVVHTVQWTGIGSDPLNPNRLDFTEEGTYTFAIRAENPAQPELFSLYRGVIQVRE